MADNELNMRILVHVWAVAEDSRHRVIRSVEERSLCSHKEFRALQNIQTSIENVTATELARRMRCSKANITYVVRPLMMRGWVTSEAAFGDARAAILRLTDSGRGVYEDYRLALIRASNRHLEELDADEKQRLVTIFKKIGARGRG